MRLRPHRLPAFVLAVLVAASFTAATTARRVVQDNEDRLLVDRTSEIQSLLESLGSSYEAQIAAVAAIAKVTDGDLDQFRTAVADVDPGAATATGGGWVLMRHTAAGWTRLAAVGTPTDPGTIPPDWQSGLDNAAQGRFSLLGFVGSGLSRRFGMANGRPTPTGALVVYSEWQLLAATGAASAGAQSPIDGVAVNLYVGKVPDPDRLLFDLGEFDEGKALRRPIDVGGAPLYLEVSPTGPLGGSLANSLPRLLLFGGALLGLSLSAVLEVIQRRRDDAVSTVADLELQNRRLDDALHEQQVTETARAALEIELRQSQRLEAIGHLAGGVAHDFNNVLAAILSYADLASDGVTEPTVREDLESIQNAARRGADLTRKLLQFSRRRAGEVSLVDVNLRVKDIASMLGRTLGEDVALTTRLTADPATALADPVELDQVLLNLVVNARDAVGPGGTIEIATDLVETAGLEVPELVYDRVIRLTVTDDGCGMTPEVVEHAFDPFFTTKGRGEGTGLGLSTVYGIVQRLGGHVAAQSTPGVGTTIEVLLPASVDTGLVPAVVEEPESTAAGSGRTVLVVEDEAPLRRAMRRMLERAGFVVLESADGLAALGEHQHAHLDLLLTDVVMPKGVTGVDVAAGLRQHDRGLPVVFVTGYSDEILDPAELDGSHTVLLSKPFSETELLDAVGALIGAPT